MYNSLPELMSLVDVPLGLVLGQTVFTILVNDLDRNILKAETMDNALVERRYS